MRHIVKKGDFETFEKVEILAKTTNGRGKELRLISSLNNLTVSSRLQVWIGTNPKEDLELIETTQILNTAIEKYNEIPF